MSKRNLSQAGRAKYDGPRSHYAIIRQIHEDSRKEMSYDFIYKVVGLFFSSIGIQKYMKRGENFKVPMLGSFMITKAERKRRAREAWKQKEKIRLKHNAKMRKYGKKRRILKRMDKINANRAEIGMPPLDYETFKVISRKR